MDYIRQIKTFATFSQLFDFRADQVKVDNAVFRLHSQATVMILMVGTMFVSMRQYFGEPIECMASRTDLPSNMLQHYCWLESTFSVTDGTPKTTGVEVAYPGVKTLNTSAGERKVYHKYYQWVYFILILQSIMFYIPKYLWKAKEGKRLRTLINDLKQRHVAEMSEYDSKRIVQDVVDSLLISDDYFFFFFFCEFLYFINLIAQIWFTNIFLGGQFTRLGLDWLSYNHDQLDNKHDPLIRVFPRMTKCLFHKYGYSGAIERHDALCFLPLNIVNEKIYTVLWFWYVFIFTVTSLCLLQRVALVLFPALRYKKLLQIAPSTDREHLKLLTSRVGQWFILHNLANNLKPYFFKDLVSQVSKEMMANNADHNQSSSGQPQSMLTKAIVNGLGKIANSRSRGGKAFGMKHKENMGFSNINPAPPSSAYVVDREPPSGVSISGSSSDWLNMRNAGWP